MDLQANGPGLTLKELEEPRREKEDPQKATGEKKVVAGEEPRNLPELLK